MTNERVMNDPEIKKMIRVLSRKMASIKGDPLLADDFAQELFIIMRGIDGDLHPHLIRYQAWKALIDAGNSRRYNYSWGGANAHISIQSAELTLGSTRWNGNIEYGITKSSGLSEQANLSDALADPTDYEKAAMDHIVLQELESSMERPEERLAIMEKGKGYTTEETAVMLGVSRSMVSKIVNRPLVKQRLKRIKAAWPR